MRSQVLVIKCDICFKEVQNSEVVDSNILFNDVNDSSDTQIHLVNNDRQADICLDCFRKKLNELQEEY